MLSEWLRGTGVAGIVYGPRLRARLGLSCKKHKHCSIIIVLILYDHHDKAIYYYPGDIALTRSNHISSD